jgi:hypothetical protein
MHQLLPQVKHICNGIHLCHRLQRIHDRLQVSYHPDVGQWLQEPTTSELQLLDIFFLFFAILAYSKFILFYF